MTQTKIHGSASTLPLRQQFDLGLSAPPQAELAEHRNYLCGHGSNLTSDISARSRFLAGLDSIADGCGKRIAGLRRAGEIDDVHQYEIRSLGSLDLVFNHSGLELSTYRRGVGSPYRADLERKFTF